MVNLFTRSSKNVLENKMIGGKISHLFSIRKQIFLVSRFPMCTNFPIISLLCKDRPYKIIERCYTPYI